MRKVFSLAVVFSLVAAISYAAFEVTIKEVLPGIYYGAQGEGCDPNAPIRIIDTDTGIMLIMNLGLAGGQVGDTVLVETTNCYLQWSLNQILVYERVRL